MDADGTLPCGVADHCDADGMAADRKMGGMLKHCDVCWWYVD